MLHHVTLRYWLAVVWPWVVDPYLDTHARTHAHTSKTTHTHTHTRIRFIRWPSACWPALCQVVITSLSCTHTLNTHSVQLSSSLRKSVSSGVSGVFWLNTTRLQCHAGLASPTYLCSRLKPGEKQGPVEPALVLVQPELRPVNITVYTLSLSDSSFHDLAQPLKAQDSLLLSLFDCERHWCAFGIFT